jgi:hypothetical protein
VAVLIGTVEQDNLSSYRIVNLKINKFAQTSGYISIKQSDGLDGWPPTPIS